MISKRIVGRKDGKSSAFHAMRYGQGLTPDLETGEFLDKSHRTRLGNFGLVDDGVYADPDQDMAEVIELAALEMQSNCDLNSRVGPDKKLAHFVVSFDQDRPSEAVLRDTEDSMLSAMGLDKNHFASFLHNDNGFWHAHIFVSRIEKEKPHRGNPLWHDRTNRDRVCREIEVRHGLHQDNGLHKVDEQGQIVEIPREERIAKREAKPAGLTDRAKTKEIYSGEKSFQSWVNEIRLGDRLKHAKSWQDLHGAAAAYGCEVRARGAGFVVCPTGEKGGIQLSKIGVKNLPARFGVFEAAKPGHQAKPEAVYKPSPTNEKGAGHYNKWAAAKKEFLPVKTERLNEQREIHKQTRKNLREVQQAEIAKIRASAKGQDKVVAISVAKMQHTLAQTALTEQLAHERQALRRQLAAMGPGNTFRDYLVSEAGKGDNAALTLARKYGVDESTEVLRKREAAKLKIVAAAGGYERRPAPRLNFTHHVDRTGSIVFDFGHGRKLVDSAISKQVQLNNVAASDPDSIATALRFAASKFGNTLTLTGSAEFQKLAVETAVSRGLFVKFADPALDAYREKLVLDQKQKSRTSDFSHLSRSQITKGVKHVLNRSFDHGIPPDHILRAYKLATDQSQAAADRSRRLHELSAGSLDAGRQNAEVLLPNPLSGRVGDKQAGQDPSLRRPGAGESGSGRAADLGAATATSTILPNLGAIDRDRDGHGLVRPAGAERSSPPGGSGGLHVAIDQPTQPPVELVEAEDIEITAAAWITSQPKPEVPAFKSGDGTTEHIVAHVSDMVVIDHGRAVARYPIPEGLVVRPGQRIVITKSGAVAPAPERTQEAGKNRAD